jgi:hypothetical protein
MHKFITLFNNLIFFNRVHGVNLLNRQKFVKIPTKNKMLGLISVANLKDFTKKAPTIKTKKP